MGDNFPVFILCIMVEIHRILLTLLVWRKEYKSRTIPIIILYITSNISIFLLLPTRKHSNTVVVHDFSVIPLSIHSLYTRVMQSFPANEIDSSTLPRHLSMGNYKEEYIIRFVVCGNVAIVQLCQLVQVNSEYRRLLVT